MHIYKNVYRKLVIYTTNRDELDKKRWNPTVPLLPLSLLYVETENITILCHSQNLEHIWFVL